MIDHIRRDLHYALRTLRRDPVLTLAALATLAIAIGANTTVFSLVNSILLRPLPFPAAERLYWVSERLGRDQMEVGLGPDYYSLRDGGRIFQDVAAFDTLTVNWDGIERPEQLDAAQVTPSFFTVLGVRPLMGRYLAGGEEGKDAPPLVVLSYAFWRSRLGSDPHAVGKTIRLDSQPATVIGVMPQGFDYPQGTQVWRPLPMDKASQLPRSAMRPVRLVYIVARLKPQVDERRLQGELPQLTRMIRAEYPHDFEAAGFLQGMRILAMPLQRRIVGDLRPALLVLSGAVALVLLIACANLANLLLARAAARRRELAVRMALGAGRGRIVRQVLTESLALGLPGGVAGIAIACLAVAGLNAWKPLVLARYPALSVDLPTLAFTFAVAVVTGLLFGLAPAVGAAGIHIQEAFKAAGASHSGSRGAARLRQLLVVLELGVSLVLLIGAGLLTRSFVKLAATNLGFAPQNLLTMRVNLVGQRYAKVEGQTGFYDAVLERVKSLSMVREAAVSTDVPLSGGRAFQQMSFQIAGRAPLPMAQQPETNVCLVSSGFFRTMGIPLLQGRTFDAEDTTTSPDHVVVNEAFARRIFAAENPVGKQMVLGRNDQSRWTIVGVVGNIGGSELGADPMPLVYRSTTQAHSPYLTRLTLIVSTAGDPRAPVRTVADQVYAVDRSQPVFDVKTMEQRLDDSLAPRRFQLLLIGTFAFIAIVLAALGVYGVMSYLVTQRTREIGIRMAMGARPGQVERLVVGETVALALVAVAAGLGGAWGLTRYLKSMLYGVTPLDGPTLAAMPLLLVGIALAASFVPARKAARIDPMVALREE